LIVTVLLLSGCEKAPEWKGWVYPNKSALVVDVPIGAFSTLQECRASAREILSRMNTYENGEKVEGDYECGFQCKLDGGLGGLNVCQKTER
jgi:hypothetical protein